MKEGYYYLITSLPELSLADKNPGYDVLSFREYAREHLSASDSRLLNILYYPFDIENLIILIKDTDKPWRQAGSFSREELQHMLSEPELMPAFLQSFVAETQKKWDVMTPKALLNVATTFFIDWSHTLPNAFLKRWLLFDQNLKNLLIWLNSHKFGLDPNEEVLGNHDEAEYLRNTKAGELNLKTWDFQFREAVHHFDNPDIAVREMIINEMRWHYLEELIQPYSFGVEHLLAFAIRLQLINRNLTDADDAGRKRLDELIDGIMSNYRLPEYFT